MKDMKHPAFALVLSLVIGTAGYGQTEASTPEVWFHHAKALQFVREGAEWNYVKQHIDGIQFFIDALSKYPQDELKELVQVLKTNDIKISVECGGLLEYAPLDDTNGESTARIELAKIENLAGAGGTPDFLNMDGPIRRLMFPGEGKKGFESVERCADQLVIYMKKVRERYPEIQFFLLTNFPNWGWKDTPCYWGTGENSQGWGDYARVLPVVVEKTKEAGVSLLGVTADNPYDYLMGLQGSPKLDDPKSVDWMKRLRELEDYVKAQGLEFNLIINSQRGGDRSAKLFYEDTLAFLDAYRNAGGAPTRYIVESWYREPVKVVPEDEPYTMAYVVKQVVRQVKGEGSKR
jgi:hypothetical protein